MLTKRLRREAKASPKKAGALGLLLLVAVYYWMPLLKNAIVKENPAAEPATANPGGEFAMLVAGQSASQPAAAPRPKTPDHNWEQMANWLDDNVTSRPATGLVARRNPFEPVRQKTAQVETEPEPGADEQNKTFSTPDSLGMQLSATVIGPRRRVAVIDGKAYAEGRSVESNRDGQTIEFRLVAIHPQRIVLEKSGQHFELAIPKRAASAQIESINQ